MNVYRFLSGADLNLKSKNLSMLLPLFFIVALSSTAFGAGRIRSALDEKPYLPKTGVFVINNNTSAPNLSRNYGQLLVRGYATSYIWDYISSNVPEYEWCESDYPKDYENKKFCKNLLSQKNPKEEVISILQNMLESQNAVDIYIFSHSNSFYELLENISPLNRKKIRMIYNAGCKDAGDANSYLKQGVGSYVGHLGDSYSWLFVNAFSEAWKRGHTVYESVEIGNFHAKNHIIGLEGKILGKIGAIDNNSIEDETDAINGTKAKAFGKNLSIHSFYSEVKALNH